MHRIIRRQLLQVTPIWQFLIANISTFKSNDKRLLFVRLGSSLASILFMLQIFCTLLQMVVTLQGITQTHRQKEFTVWVAVRGNQRKSGEIIWKARQEECDRKKIQDTFVHSKMSPSLLIKKINSCNSQPALTSHHYWLATGTSHRGSKEAERRDVSLMNNRARYFF